MTLQQVIHFQVMTITYISKHITVFLSALSGILWYTKTTEWSDRTSPWVTDTFLKNCGTLVTKTSKILFFLVGLFTICNDRFSCERISLGSPQIIRFLLGLSVSRWSQLFVRCSNNSSWQYCESGGWWIPAIFPDWAEQELGKRSCLSFLFWN